MILLTKAWLFYILMLTYMNVNANQHPHGEANKIINVHRDDDQAELIGDFDVIDKIFLHPEVKDRKIVVFSIVGAYREGKSFFLDYCLRYLYATYGSINTGIDIQTQESNDNWVGDGKAPLSGFSWMHGSIADTKGIMIWSDVFLYDEPNGDKIAIVLMDTQGLFEPGSPDEENAKIFSFSTLLSSIQIINIKETIKENQISHLKSVIDLTKVITNNQKVTKSKPFQNLLFLIRDFDDENFEYGYGGGQQYFDNFFSLTQSKKSKTSVNRQSIRESFDSISCYLLPHPGKKVKKPFFKGQWNLLDEDFREGLKILIESLLTPGYLVKKTVFGIEVTSSEFRELLLNYLEAYGSFETPQVENIFEATINAQMGSIVKELQRKYLDAMNIGIIYDREDFVQWAKSKHEEEKYLALQGFLIAKKIENEESEAKYLKKLEQDIDEIYNHWSDNALKVHFSLKATKKIQELFASKLKDYEIKMNTDLDYEIDNFEDVIENKSNNVSYIINEEFLNELQVFSNMINIDVFSANFEPELQKIRSNWIDAANNNHQKIKMEKLVNSLSQKHHHTMLSFNDFDQEDFDDFYRGAYSTETRKILENFKEQTQGYDDVDKYKEMLVNKIEGQYEYLSTSKLKEYEEHIKMKEVYERNQLMLNVEKSLPTFYQLMEKDLNMDEESFENYINRKYSLVEIQVLENFIKLTKDFSKYRNEYTKLLNQKIEESFASWKQQKIIEYAEHQKRKMETIKREMETLVKTFVLLYEKNMTENLSFTSNDFEQMIDEKHTIVKSETISNFISQAISDESTYVEDLTANIDTSFSNLKQKKLREHQEIIEMEQNVINTGIEVFMEDLIQQYVDSMNKDNDITRDNFFTLFNDKHNEVKEKLNVKLMNNPQLSKSLKQSSHISRFAEKIEIAYNIEKQQKKVLYDEYQEQKRLRITSALKNLVNHNHKMYNLNMDKDNDFDQETFPSTLDPKHEKTKKNALMEFDNSLTSEYQILSSTFRNELIDLIEKSYKEWKINVLKSYKDHQVKMIEAITKNVRQIKNTKLNAFKNELAHVTYLRAQYLSENFNTLLEKKMNELKSFKITELKNAVKHFNKPNIEKQFQDELVSDMDSILVVWRKKQIDESIKYKDLEEDRKLIEFSDNQVKNYELKMVENLDYTRNDFESMLRKRHDDYLNNAITNVEQEYRRIKSNKFDASKLIILKNALKNKVNNKFENIERTHVKEYKNLAVWVSWRNEKESVPDNAVVGGNDENELYVGRREMTGYGWMNGKYSAKRKQFYIPNVGLEHEFNKDSIFQLLVHKNHKWIDSVHGGRKIVGATKPDGTHLYICRAQFTNGKHPGKYDGRICYVPWDGKEHQFDANFEMLVLND